MISRPIDIWSFGFIVAEVCTYMNCGADGVQKCKESRKIHIGYYKTYTFHANNQPHEKVTIWLSKLEIEGDRSIILPVHLVRSMLSMKPVDRPKAHEVTATLGFIAVDSYMQFIEDSYHKISRMKDSFEAYIELDRLKSWMWAFELVKDKNDPWNHKMDIELNFKMIIEKLISIISEMEEIESRVQDALSPLFVNLSTLNDQLIDLLPREIQQRAKTRLEIALIGTEDTNLLEEMQTVLNESSPHRRIGMLATIKRMSILASKHLEEHSKDIYMDAKCVRDTTAFGDHSLAVVEGTPERRVLIEWIRYDTHWDGPVSEVMFQRAEAVAKLLNSTLKPPSFRVLHCSKFLQNPPAFGLLYDFPGKDLSD
jgi:serine/threonine protein kinase